MEIVFKQYPPYINLHAVREITTLSRSTIYNLIQKGEFPRPKKLLGQRTVWDTGAVMDWMQDRLENTGRTA